MRISPLLLAVVVTCTGLVARAEDLTPATGTSAKGLFVAVGYGGRRVTTRDGVHWENDVELAPNGGDDDNCLFSVAFGHGRFVAVGGGAGVGRIMTTVDGR